MTPLLRLLPLALLVTAAQAQPLQITNVAVPSAPRATEGSLVTIPLRVTVQNTGRNPRFAYVTARVGSGPETERVTSSDRIAPDASATLTVPLPVDLRVDGAVASVSAEVLAYSNATRVVDRQTVSLPVERTADPPPADPPPDDPPPRDPPPSGELIPIRIPVDIANQGRGQPALGRPIESIATRFPPSLGFVTVGVLERGRPASETYRFVGINPPPETGRIVGMKLAVMAQNLGLAARRNSFVVHYDAEIGGRRLQGSQTYSPFMGSGGVSPLVLSLGEFPDASVCEDSTPRSPINVPDPLAGVRQQARQACIASVTEDERVRDWPFLLRSGDSFRITLRLEAPDDASADDNGLVLEGSIGGELELVLRAPQIQAP